MSFFLLSKFLYNFNFQHDSFLLNIFIVWKEANRKEADDLLQWSNNRTRIKMKKSEIKVRLEAYGKSMKARNGMNEL